MAANKYSLMTERLQTVLAAGLVQYTALRVDRKIFKPNDLADFTRYCIVISPNGNPWEERREGVPKIGYIFRADLWLLVKNWDETLSVYGTAAPDLGLLQLVEDVKDLLRLSDLEGLIDRGSKTYDEPAGPLTLDSTAVAAFDSAEKTWVHRARLVYTARMTPFCHERLP